MNDANLEGDDMQTTARKFQGLEVENGSSSKDWKSVEHPRSYRDMCFELQRQVYRWQILAAGALAAAIAATVMLVSTVGRAFPV